VSQSRAVVNKMLRNTPPRQVVDGGWGGHAEAPTVFVDEGAKEKPRRFLWMGEQIAFRPPCGGSGAPNVAAPSHRGGGGKKSCLPPHILSVQKQVSSINRMINSVQVTKPASI
jgi:hypothetical protein